MAKNKGKQGKSKESDVPKLTLKEKRRLKKEKQLLRVA